jgi:hypothetical protein
MKKIAFLAFVVLSAVTLSACTPGKTVNEKISEEIVEKTLEGQTGAKVDVDSQGKNITIKSDDGQVQYSAGGEVDLPQNFPRELIVVDDAKVILASSGEGNSAISYVTNFEHEIVKQKYVGGLAGQGWKKEMEVDAGSGIMLTFRKETMSVVINVGENANNDQPGKTLVNVMYAIE